MTYSNRCRSLKFHNPESNIFAYVYWFAVAIISCILVLIFIIVDNFGSKWRTIAPAAVFRSFTYFPHNFTLPDYKDGPGQTIKPKYQPHTGVNGITTIHTYSPRTAF